MSLGAFLSRWSKRKTAADPGTALEPVPPEADAVPPTGADEEVLSPIDPASLPSIDDITAQTDLRVFLAPNLPVDLARAALRRAWSVDPDIRDYVGPADYAWDFNAPDAMAGFGPLKMSDELRNELVQALFEPPKPTADEDVKEDVAKARSDASDGTVGVVPADVREAPVSDPSSSAGETQTPDADTTGLTRYRRGGGALPA